MQINDIDPGPVGLAGVPHGGKRQADAASFAATLAATQTTGAADFVSGRIGIDLDKRGHPARVIYFDEAGRPLTNSAFSAPQILRNASGFGIDLGDLAGLVRQLDAAGIGYRPHELYRGTGSNHGIDFDDLIAGGLGTAYDWREDANVAQKGPSASIQLAEARALSAALGLEAHAGVTDVAGAAPALPRTDGDDGTVRTLASILNPARESATVRPDPVATTVAGESAQASAAAPARQAPSPAANTAPLDPHRLLDALIASLSGFRTAR